MVLNLLPWARSEVVRSPMKSQTAHYLHASGENGVLSSRELNAASDDSNTSIKEIKKGCYQLSNKQYMVEVSEGAITSLYDRIANREVIPRGERANQFVLFDDKPLYWQAWDVEVYHLNSRQELPSGKTVVTERGPHRVSVTTETKISDKSWIRTNIGLSAVVDDNQPACIEMESEVEWHETMKFLKVEFPVDIVNTEASYETQFGIVRRPTHYNTTWDMAKFEVCCHKWADLSEAGYGVSILNDSKYGFATCGNLMRLSLLRAPKAPDAHADMGTFFSSFSLATCVFPDDDDDDDDTNVYLIGRHKIRYAILPHPGPLNHITVRKAFEFNHPLAESIHSHPSPTAVTPLLSAIKLRGSEALILDTIKRGEDDEDVGIDDGSLLVRRKGRSVVLRIYDSLGGKARGRIEWDGALLPVKKVCKCNVLEDDGEELTGGIGKKGSDGGRDFRGVDIELRAFEVATYRLQL